MAYRKIERVEKWSGAANAALVFTVGTGGVKEIGEHLPMGPGDVCYYDVMMDDSSQTRVFYPDVVRYSKMITLDTPQTPKIIT